MRRRLRGVPPADARTAPPAPREDLASQVAVLRDAVRRARSGDLESRVPEVQDPELAALRSDVNGLLDVVDAFMREAVASLEAATRGEYHRRLLVQGLPGAYGQAAAQIDAARGAMKEADEARDEQRRRLVEQASAVTALVNDASGALSGSASGVVEAAHRGAEEVARARETMQELEKASGTIGEAAALIRHVAARTRLLSLNATIEAARAGEAGRGFAVVAGEVKTLADEVSSSSDDITAHVADAQTAAAESVAAMARVEGVIATVSNEADSIAVAAGQGLADMAHRLKEELARFDCPTD